MWHESENESLSELKIVVLLTSSSFNNVWISHFKAEISTLKFEIQPRLEPEDVSKTAILCSDNNSLVRKAKAPRSWNESIPKEHYSCAYSRCFSVLLLLSLLCTQMSINISWWLSELLHCSLLLYHDVWFEAHSCQ